MDEKKPKKKLFAIIQERKEPKKPETPRKKVSMPSDKTRDALAEPNKKGY